MKKDFWRLLRKYCSESSILGLKYFYMYPDPLSRCFWTIYLLASLAISFTLSLLLYWRFAEMPTRITIESQHEKLENLAYPAITICSPNQITVSSMKYFNKSLVDGDVSINLERALPLALGFGELIDPHGIGPTLEHLQKLFDINRYKITEVIDRMAQGCDRFVKYCRLPQEPHMHCSRLFGPVLTAHGLCCAFNSVYYFSHKTLRNELKPHFKARSPRAGGFLDVFTVVTECEPEDAVDGTLVNVGAMRLMYTETNEFPTDDETTLLDPGGESFHLIRATHTYCSEEVRALSASSRQCLFEDERELKFFKKYRNSDCDHMCSVRAIHEFCGCWMLFLPDLPLSQACKLTNIPCIMNVRKNMSKWMTDSFCDCPRDCESTRYLADVILGNVDALSHTYNYDPYMKQNYTKSMSILNFVFAKPVYTKQKQETVMPLISLVSNLGGVFGLFLGCSWISLLECLFYIYIGIKNYIKRRLKNNAVHNYH